ncbi:hypothetical protein I3760_10G157800 [Carya illinoinensis]|nr:hypothetical protein I3760_10G157800 [Carya illinoinensis]
MPIPLFLRLFLLSMWSLFLTFSIFGVAGSCLATQQSLLLQLKSTLVFDIALSTKLGRVTGLDLSEESISGGLGNSSTLFGLQHLQNLNLAKNRFDSSHIPTQLKKLKNLSYLNLSYAGFAGQIPIQISYLTRLVTLDLSSSTGSNLTLQSPNLATLVHNLSELREIYLDHVNISAKGYEWCRAISTSLPNLRVLSLPTCSLSGPLDSSLLNLQFLSVLRLDWNNISTSVPEFLADLKSLTSLSFFSCGLNGTFPEKIFQIPTLQTLDLTCNGELQGSLPEFPPNESLQTLKLSATSFSGTLPSSIGKLKMLCVIDFHQCHFSGHIPHSMASLKRLVYLDMSSNLFSGPIPSFSVAENLTLINLADNNLTGEITSTRWDGLLKLENFDLSNNSLEGSIPVSLFSLPSLQKLSLFKNRFSGQLNEFPNLSSYLLNTLDLNSNNLEGPIPMSIFELQGLETLSLSSNNFSGSLQLNMFQQLSYLFELDLSHNNLLIECDGTSSSLFSSSQISKLSLASSKLKTFPDCLRNLSYLNSLDISDNQIHQEIPNWIWHLPSLSELNMSHNHLMNRRPLLNLSTLWIVDLQSNQLQGPLPIFQPGVLYLDFSRNYFCSAIPRSIGNLLYDAVFFSVSSNKFYGNIPKSVCNATSLEVLDMSNNSFSGKIPQCLTGTRGPLAVLNLKRNNLTGTISNTFARNCSLQTLALNGNQLEGKVPKLLEVLDIGNNNMEDTFPCHLKNGSMLRVLILRFNRFHGPIGCLSSNATWSMIQIVDLGSNNFSGKLPTNAFSTWKAMMADELWAQSELNHLRFDDDLAAIHYKDTIAVTVKGLVVEMAKILTVFTSLDLSCNNFEGPIPGEIGQLKSLYLLNMSQNSFMGRIPPSLGKLSHLESLDLSSNKLTGEIPVQLADGLTFLSVLNLSFNQLVGRIPLVQQFGLCGIPLKEKCTDEKATPSPPTLEESHSNSESVIEWNFLSVEFGFVFGFGIVVGPLMFWRRWRFWYSKQVDDILFKIFPKLYLRKEYRPRIAHRNLARRRQ